eukprot:905931-Prorocentrum_minimum.AAC.3
MPFVPRVVVLPSTVGCSGPQSLDWHTVFHRHTETNRGTMFVNQPAAVYLANVTMRHNTASNGGAAIYR